MRIIEVLRIATALIESCCSGQQFKTKMKARVQGKLDEPTVGSSIWLEFEFSRMETASSIGHPCVQAFPLFSVVTHCSDERMRTCDMRNLKASPTEFV